MIIGSRFLLARALFALSAALALDATAAVQRTFVASHGVDSNPCSLVSPCRSFGAALAQTASGGEIVVLDSAGYGAVSITQSVSIVAPPGIYAGVSVFSGAGITVNAGAGHAVTLRGLTLNGLGGTTGVAFQSGDALYLDRVVVGGFAAGGGIGVHAAMGAASSTLSLRDSSLHDNATGLKTATTGGTLTLTIERSMFGRNAIGADIQGISLGAIRKSTFSAGGVGLSAGAAGSGQAVKLEIRDCTFSDNSASGVTATSPSSPTLLNVISSLVTGNATGIQIGGNGNTAYVSDSTIMRNALGLSATLSGTLESGGDNRVFLNSTDGNFVPPANQPPIVNAGADIIITLPAMASLSGSVSDDGRPNPPGAVTVGWSKVSGPGTVTFSDASAATTSASFSVDGVYVLRLTADDGALNATDDVQVTVNPEGSLPPDPATVAPTLDRSVPTSIAESTAFLHTGTNPIQTGVAPGTIEFKRAAVLRGRVLDRTGAALPGVTISINAHPEFGQTLSRADGRFDLVVNGGGQLTVSLAKSGLLPGQRTLAVPWSDYVVVDDAVLTPLDTQVTNVAVNAGAMQVHRGTATADARGNRRATLFIPAGTTATMTLPNGTTQPLSTLNIRATEYTLGPDGPKAMPAGLPPTSGYTYATEFSVDEAVAAGATGVTFNQALASYTDNFLGFPVGTVVPTGFYDRQKAAWLASGNGRVVKIIGATGGLADVDSVGTGTLVPLSLSNAERAQLASTYAVGQELWRVPLTHFSPSDYNWPYSLPLGATDPNQPQPGNPDPTVDQCLTEAPVGSVVECQNQILGETVPIVGTPYALDYRSLNAPGRTLSKTLRIPVTGFSIPANLKRVDVKVNILGQSYFQSFAPVPNQQMTVTWDGRDVYGRLVQGHQRVTGSVGYVYDGVYLQPRDDFDAVWAQFGKAIQSSTAGEFVRTQPINAFVRALDMRPVGLGGWTLSPHHVYDAVNKQLTFGSGKRSSPGSVDAGVLKRDPRAVGLEVESDLALAPDGTVYFLSQNLQGLPIIAISPDGTITQYDESSFPVPVDYSFWFIALGPDGRLYLSDGLKHRVFALSPSNGTATIVAGTGAQGFWGDGGPATSAGFNYPAGLAFGPDGSLYVADNLNHRVRRVDPSGIINTVAGTGVLGFNGDGGPAAQAEVGVPVTLAVAADGTLYIGNWPSGNGMQEGARIRRVTTDGTITTYAGDGSPCLVAGQCGDGGPAMFASVMGTRAMAVRTDGTLYFSEPDDVLGGRVRQISPEGIINLLAGNPLSTTSEIVNMLAKAPNSVPARGIAVAPDGVTYLAVANFGLFRLEAIHPGIDATDSLVASEDGSVLYDFDPNGRHLRTLNALTGAILREFTYDATGRLASITEKTGGTDNVTTIQHDVNGNPVKIIGAYGKETLLSVDANGFLAGIINPAGESIQLISTASGLLQKFTDPRGNFSQYAYDSDGRLTQASDPAGGVQTFARSEFAGGYSVAKTTALGRTTTYKVEELPGGDHRLTTTLPSGEATVLLQNSDGTSIVTQPDGTVVTTVLGPDPRFGMQSPFASSTKITTPGGITALETATRTASLLDPNDIFSLVSQTDTITESGKNSISTYTSSNRTRVARSPALRVQTIVTDTLGRTVSSQVAGFNATSYAYDSRGRVSSITQGTGPTSRTFAFAYDAQGYLQSVTDPLGRTVQYMRDTTGRVMTKTLPGNVVVSFTRNLAGDVVGITPPGKPVSTFTYNGRGDLTSITPPVVAGSGPTTIGYDQDGDLTQILRPGSEQITTGFDTSGRVNAITGVVSGLPNANYALAYDGVGRLQSVTGPGAQAVTLGYDGALRTTTTWGGQVGGTLAWAYDNRLHLASETVTGAPAVAFAYDNDDLLTAAGSLAIVRNAQNGFPQSSSLGTVSDSSTFSGFGELASYSATASGAPIYAVAFVRDALGRLTQKQETIGGSTDIFVYSYDALGQLTQVTRNGAASESYLYDANGNRTSATVSGTTTAATYDDQDRLLSLGTTTYTHSPSGNRLTRSAISGNTSYSYDARGNVLAVTLPGSTVVSYLLDGLDRRVGKQVNGTTTMQFLYSGSRVIAQLDGGGAVVSRFVYGNALVPSYMIKGGSTYRLITDSIGSVRLVVDSATGVIAQRIDYNAFGVVTQDTNTGFQPFGFAGGLYDPATGLVRFGARDYDAEAGRWTAKDPIAYSGNDTNFYRYSYNDPVNLIDPSGMITLDDALEFGAGFVETVGGAAAVLGNLPTVLIDALARSAGSAFGYPPAGPSLFETLTHPFGDTVDRSTAAYTAGEIAGDVALVCGDLATLVAPGAALARKGLAALSKRALAREAAREAEKRAAMKAAKEAAKATEAAERKAAAKLRQYAEEIRAEPKKSGHIPVKQFY